jgi:hypothetical protein
LAEKVYDDQIPHVIVCWNGFEGLNMGVLSELKRKIGPTKIGGAPKSKVGALIWVPLLELL